MYQELQPALIRQTLEKLEARIGERFPGSGLSSVATEVRMLAADLLPTLERLRDPIWPVRGAAFAAIGLLLIVVFTLVALSLRVSFDVDGFAELLQATEAGVNDVILLSFAIYFLASLEGRFKRRSALESLHRLRSVVHIIDMHQLTKDPSVLLSESPSGTASPSERTFTQHELARYLDYCSELLSLASKLAALHVQYLRDPVVLGAVTEIENLAGGLSSKIWQKIMMLDLTAPEGAR